MGKTIPDFLLYLFNFTFYIKYLWQMKYTQHTLDKIESVLSELNYVIRYERGTFQSGYCILEDKKVVVLNKFLQLEGRINTLMDIVPKLAVDTEALSVESRRTLEQIIAESKTIPE